FIALMPDGRVYATENGCFAKTFALDPRDEPTLYRGVTHPSAYLENVSQDAAGTVDFFDSSSTQNGRAVFPMRTIEPADPLTAPKAEVLLTHNRNATLPPAVARLSGARAAAYFMLGESMGTSAAGKEMIGQAVREPGTNPFFPLRHALQGNRLLEILRSH